MLITKAQRTLLEIQGRQSELRSRLAVLAGMDTRTTDEESELTTVETKLSGCEPELRAALVAAAAADDSARTVQTTDSEGRERLELRAKTGLADFLRAAAGGTSVTGAAAEYAEALGIPESGRLPMALFARTTPTVETRAVHAWAWRRRSSTADRTVCVRAKRRGEPRDHDAYGREWPGPDPEDHHGATG